MLRVDVLLVEQGLAPSRTAAQGMIAAGRVSSGGRVISKASLKLAQDCVLDLAVDESDRFVSRGGFKLAGALAQAGVDVAGMQVLDVGISTGGFSDCLLQAGARKVIGVEVGHGQLHPRLLADQRIVQFEGVNARHLSPALIASAQDGPLQLIVGDVSFISLTLILPALRSMLQPQAALLFLVKPQFEVGKAGIARGGIVKDESLYAEVEVKIKTAAIAAGFMVKDYFASSITGGDGNREFFIYALAL
ncbi:TlyA family RNA methyltransferase [Iodobacter sp. CM08]|uniref:TlyA family RNA methyltransferase n=1 Tax=Iodobacter sp. CM08 TaxID=3085902 RepID=UPI0029818C71|nr:TlyA family RNA methyltransferase [Iodobacter sp. CM08]MDW5415400.1 TlyA family RNA methyltransferase [Iodobacter sp. CM08]